MRLFLERWKLSITSLFHHYFRIPAAVEPVTSQKQLWAGSQQVSEIILLILDSLEMPRL